MECAIEKCEKQKNETEDERKNTTKIHLKNNKENKEIEKRK